MPVYWRRWWTNRGFSKITHVIAAMYFTTFESLIVYRNTRRPCYVSKRLIAASFESSEPLHLLRLIKWACRRHPYIESLPTLWYMQFQNSQFMYFTHVSLVIPSIPKEMYASTTDTKHDYISLNIVHTWHNYITLNIVHTCKHWLKYLHRDIYVCTFYSSKLV